MLESILKEGVKKIPTGQGFFYTNFDVCRP